MGNDQSGEPASTRIGADFGTLNLGGFAARFGALVGKFGGVRFLAGTSFSAVAPATGNLSLLYWDSPARDNVGSVLVSINEDGGPGGGGHNGGGGPVPEPGTIALLALGLAGLGFRQRCSTV